MKICEVPKGFIVEKIVKDGDLTNTFNYIYDKIGQLIEVKKNNSTIETYSYDSNGNRLNNNAQYDSQDRLISNSSTTFGYTERGTLTSRTENNQTTSYNYDLMGNLLSVTLPNSTEIEYITDARNRRIAKKVNGTVVQKFLYLNQLEPIAELDANDNLVSLFIYGTRSNTPDYIIKNNVKYKVVTNQLGSVGKVVNTTNGTVEQSIDYDSFGNILNDSNPNFQPFRLAGGLYDNDTKLTRFGARDYDAREGRWTTKDPIKFDGGRNFYVYALNNPIMLIDITGKLPKLTPEQYPYANEADMENAIDQAVKDGLQSIICKAIKNKREYGFTIRKNRGGYVSISSEDENNGNTEEVGLSIYDNTVAIVHVHVICGRVYADSVASHGSYYSENFSDEDVEYFKDIQNGSPNLTFSYVGTVLGNVYKMNKNNPYDYMVAQKMPYNLDLSECICEATDNTNKLSPQCQ